MEVLKSIISWVHIFAACASLVVGAIVLFAKKGTTKHKKFGISYFYLMLINNITALFIFNATGKWFFPHTLAVVNLLVLFPGYLVTLKKKYKYWLTVHIVCLVISYYLLVGGAVNEAFLHIKSLRMYIVNGSPLVGLTHFVVQIIFTAVLIYFLVSTQKKFKKS